MCQDFVSPSSVLFNRFWFVTISEWFWCHRSFLYFFNNLTFSLHFRLYQFDIFIFQYLFDILSKLADKSTEQVGGRILDFSCFVFLENLSIFWCDATSIRRRKLIMILISLIFLIFLIFLITLISLFQVFTQAAEVERLRIMLHEQVYLHFMKNLEDHYH